MPTTSTGGFKRIAELAGGARFPAKLLRALQRCENNREMVSRVGVHFALEQCHDLLDNDVAGIHFYTLNRSDGRGPSSTASAFRANATKKSRACNAFAAIETPNPEFQIPSKFPNVKESNSQTTDSSLSLVAIETPKSPKRSQTI